MSEIPYDRITKVVCITGGIWSCELCDEEFGEEECVPVLASRVVMKNITSMKNINEEVIMEFDPPVDCVLDDYTLKCG